MAAVVATEAAEMTEIETEAVIEDTIAVKEEAMMLKPAEGKST